jgi:hypothetical protein
MIFCCSFNKAFPERGEFVLCFGGQRIVGYLGRRYLMLIALLCFTSQARLLTYVLCNRTGRLFLGDKTYGQCGIESRPAPLVFVDRASWRLFGIVFCQLNTIRHYFPRQQRVSLVDPSQPADMWVPSD